MSYVGSKSAVAPVDNPYDMFGKLYGQMKDKESLVSVLDDVRDDLKRVSAKAQRTRQDAARAPHELVRDLEQELQNTDTDAALQHQCRSWIRASSW
jgi:hypothetical protein